MGGNPPVPFDPASEQQNPTRRYKSFRPRQAAMSALVVSAPTNKATHSLYNNSTGAQLLVLRQIRVTAAANTTAIGHLQPNSLGSHSGAEQMMVPDGAALPGQHFYADTATGITATFLKAVAPASPDDQWNLPIAIIPPNWSFVLQDSTSAQVMNVSFTWEAIYADELDFRYEA